MEIGPLSEWVTAIAEIAAVCVALFLPYLNQHRAAVRRTKSLTRSLKLLVNEALTGDEEAIETLRMFVRISAMIDANEADQRIFRTGVEVLTLLKDPSRDLTARNKAIAALLQTL